MYWWGKMKVYYIYEDSYSAEKGLYPGVAKKIRNQIDVFAEHFDISEVQLKSKKNKIAKRLPFGSFIYCWDEIIDRVKDADYIYIRKPLIDSGFRKSLEELKKHNPYLKILVEIPTYPYDQESFGKAIAKPFYFKELINRKKLGNIVDRIVTYSEDDEIFGIPTIKIQNGLDVSKIPVAIPRENVGGEIYLIAVASLQAYHGYERVLEGMRNYYEHTVSLNSNGSNSAGREVYLVIVGTGDVECELKALTTQYNLEGKVTFTGTKNGRELEELYNQVDIALGSFGLYKRGTDLSSALKTREYLAHGFPIISGCVEDIFHRNPSAYYMEFSNDDSPININEVIAFYDRTYGSEDAREIRMNIRKYAEKNIDIANTFAPVIRYLREGY